MITPETATDLIHERLFEGPPVDVALPAAIGRTLAEVVKADRDLPPFDRVTMDGVAVRHHEVSLSGALRLQGTQAAGQPASRLADAGSAIEVMTGAVLPEGADTVVRYEDIVIDRAKGEVKWLIEPTPGQHIHRQGADARAGHILLAPGTCIGPAEIAVLASVGRNSVQVRALPSISIISTGDEIVPVEAVPQPWQIRQSNAWALQAGLQQAGFVSQLCHLPDDPALLRAGLKQAISESDVVLISGGVSKGQFDYVPALLHELGIGKIFHGVAQRPGKPFWFGRGANTTVFALPGNPVSTLLCLARYVLPWLKASMGMPVMTTDATLGAPVQFSPSLTYFLPVRVVHQPAGWWAEPRPGSGSGDYYNLAGADAFLQLPADRSEFQAGEVFPIVGLRNFC